MDSQAAQQEKSIEPELSFEVIGQRRYLVCEQAGLRVKERIPLHVWSMPDNQEKLWLMKEFVTKVKRKMHIKTIRKTR